MPEPNDSHSGNSVLDDNQNAGDQNAGDQNAGDQNAGDQTAGDQTAGDQTAGDQTAGDQTAGDQNQEPSWLDSLDEELRGNERIKDFKTPAEMAKAFADAKLAPSVPEKYEVPDGTPQQLQGWAREQGLSQEQLSGMLQLKAGLDTQLIKNIDAGNQAGLTQLFNEWGENKDRNVASAKRALDFIDEDGSLKTFFNHPHIQAGNHPVVIKALHKIGTFLQEGGVIDGKAFKAKPSKSRADRMYPNHNN